MIKKVFSILFASLLIFFGAAPTFIKSPVYAEKCPGNSNPINVQISPTTTPKLNTNINVTFDTPDEANYTIFIHKATGNQDIIFDTDYAGGTKSAGTITINLAAVPVELNKSYIVRVRNLVTRAKCGQAGFTITSTGESTPQASFQTGSPQDEYEAGMTTLPRIAVSGLNEGGQYKFILSGQWKKATIDEKGDTGRGKEFTAGLGGTIVVLDICDNGEANRQDCEDKFRSGSYRIDVVKVSNSELVASASFSISVEAISVPGLEAGEGKDVNVVASGFASTFLSFGIGIAGGIAFLLMVFGAYRLIFAGGNPDAMQQGKEIITAAIAGLLVIIFAVFILRFLGFTILGLGF